MVLLAQRDRAKTLKEMTEKSLFFYQEIDIDLEAREKHLTPEALEHLRELQTALAEISDWQAPIIHQEIEKLAARLEIKLGKLAQPLRVAVTGNTTSPPIDITLQLIGKRRVLERLNSALL